MAQALFSWVLRYWPPESVLGVAGLAVLTALYERSLMGLLCMADGAISFSVPRFTVLTAASRGATSGFCFADLLRVLAGLNGRS